MRRHGMHGVRNSLLALLGAMALIGPGLSAAGATTSPPGACCLPDGQCQSVTEFDCDGLGGNFAGADTSCAAVECAAPLGVPLLSIAGVIAAVGTLAGVGLSRLLRRQRT